MGSVLFVGALFGLVTKGKTHIPFSGSDACFKSHQTSNDASR